MIRIVWRAHNVLRFIGISENRFCIALVFCSFSPDNLLETTIIFPKHGVREFTDLATTVSWLGTQLVSHQRILLATVAR